MGEDVREELKIIPAKAVIVRHVRHVYACRHCEESSDRVPIVKADMPVPVIKGGFASPESIAHIATQKFVMGSPALSAGAGMGTKRHSSFATDDV
jgi:transposase